MRDPTRPLSRYSLLISVALLAGCSASQRQGGSETIVQGPRGSVSAPATPPGFESQWNKIDALRTSDHQAAVAVDPTNRAFLVQLDRVALSFGSIDPANGGFFIPGQILDVFDLPTEVVVIIQGQNPHCGLRYGVTSFTRMGGTGLYIGRCGQTYNFHPEGSYLLATEVGTENPEVIQYAHASTTVLAGGNEETAPSAPSSTSSQPSQEAGLARPLPAPSTGSGLTPEQAEVWAAAKTEAIAAGIDCSGGVIAARISKQKSHGFLCFSEEWVEGMWNDVGIEKLKRAVCSGPDILQRIPLITQERENNIVNKIGC